MAKKAKAKIIIKTKKMIIILKIRKKVIGKRKKISKNSNKSQQMTFIY